MMKINFLEIGQQIMTVVRHDQQIKNKICKCAGYVWNFWNSNQAIWTDVKQMGRDHLVSLT